MRHLETFHNISRVLIVALSLYLFICSSHATAQEATTIGGYGELHYNEPDGTERGALDFHRFVLFIGHGFNESISFKSELELEHTRLEAGEEKGGEIAVEQAYLDWHFSQPIGLRIGILLPPIGLINQFHEPPVFNGVERPNLDQFVIPTTWRESGAGIYGSPAEGIRYQLYVVAGMKASGFDASGIREGHQEALESSPVNPSVTGRIDYFSSQDFRLGASFFAGGTTDGDSGLGTGLLTLLSADLQYSYRDFSLRSVGVYEFIGDAQKINALFSKNVADEIYGFSVEGACNIMPVLVPSSDFSLSPFLRYERYNTQSKVSGFTADPFYDRNEITAGLTFKPTYNTVFKTDYQFFNNAAGRNSRQFNFGVGYLFN